MGFRTGGGSCPWGPCRRAFHMLLRRPCARTARRLKYFEEVFTSEHWMMRIYRVLDKPNRDARLRNPRRAKLGRRAPSKRRQPSGALSK